MVGQSLLVGSVSNGKPGIEFNQNKTPRLKPANSSKLKDLDDRTDWFQPRVVAFAGNEKDIFNPGSSEVAVNQLIHKLFHEFTKNAPVPSRTAVEVFNLGQTSIQELEFQVSQSHDGRRLIKYDSDSGELNITYVKIEESNAKEPQVLGIVKFHKRDKGTDEEMHEIVVTNKISKGTVKQQIVELAWLDEKPPTERETAFRSARYMAVENSDYPVVFDEGSYPAGPENDLTIGIKFGAGKNGKLEIYHYNLDENRNPEKHTSD